MCEVPTVLLVSRYQQPHLHSLKFRKTRYPSRNRSRDRVGVHTEIASEINFSATVAHKATQSAPSHNLSQDSKSGRPTLSSTRAFKCTHEARSCVLQVGQSRQAGRQRPADLVLLQPQGSTSATQSEPTCGSRGISKSQQTNCITICLRGIV